MPEPWETEEWEPPHSHWTIEAGGTRYIVDQEIIWRLKTALESLSRVHPKCWDWFEFVDIYNAPSAFILDTVGGWWLSSPESRARDRAHQKFFKSEEGFE